MERFLNFIEWVTIFIMALVVSGLFPYRIALLDALDFPEKIRTLIAILSAALGTMTFILGYIVTGHLDDLNYLILLECCTFSVALVVAIILIAIVFLSEDPDKMPPHGFREHTFIKSSIYIFLVVLLSFLFSSLLSAVVQVENQIPPTAKSQEGAQISQLLTLKPTSTYDGSSISALLALSKMESQLSSLALVESDDFSSNESGWDNYFDGQNMTGYENGNYFIESQESVLFLSVWGGRGRYTDGAFQTTILGPLEPGGVNVQGISIGWTTDWNNQVYAVAITSSQLCTVFQSRINNEGVQVWTKRSSGKIENFDENATQYELTLIVNNQILTAYVDGELCLEYEMKDYVGGKVGVVAESASDGEKAIFDDFKIFEGR